MDVSKLTISKETMNMNKLTNKRKRKLRENRIIELIRSKPTGTPIPIKEFMKPGNFNTEGNAYFFIQTMVDKGLIRKLSSLDKFTNGLAYEVCADVKTKPIKAITYSNNTPSVLPVQGEPEEKLSVKLRKTYDEYFLNEMKSNPNAYRSYGDNTITGMIEWLEKDGR